MTTIKTTLTTNTQTPITTTIGEIIRSSCGSREQKRIVVLIPPKELKEEEQPQQTATTLTRAEIYHRQRIIKNLSTEEELILNLELDSEKLNNKNSISENSMNSELKNFRLSSKLMASLQQQAQEYNSFHHKAIKSTSCARRTLLLLDCSRQQQNDRKTNLLRIATHNINNNNNNTAYRLALVSFCLLLAIAISSTSCYSAPVDKSKLDLTNQQTIGTKLMPEQVLAGIDFAVEDEQDEVALAEALLLVLNADKSSSR